MLYFNGMPVELSSDGDFYTDNFTTDELRCRCASCNRQKPHSIPLLKLLKFQKLREKINRPFTPNSAYRCHQHPEEVAKENGPGEHNRGAMDIPCASGAEKGRLIEIALSLGAKGIGVYDDFVHVDFREGVLVVW